LPVIEDQQIVKRFHVTSQRAKAQRVQIEQFRVIFRGSEEQPQHRYAKKQQKEQQRGSPKQNPCPPNIVGELL
jgi:hypothetical protein